MQSKKKCTRCKTTKVLDDFYNEPRNSDGKRSECKNCRNLQSKLWAKANPEKVRDKDRRWSKANPEKMRARHLRWRKKNPEKSRLQSFRSKYGPKLGEPLMKMHDLIKKLKSE